MSKEKLRASLLPDRATVLLSPCRLTGCRVTDRSSQEAARKQAQSQLRKRLEGETWVDVVPQRNKSVLLKTTNSTVVIPVGFE